MTPEERAALCVVCGKGVTLPHEEWCRRVAEANRRENEKANPALRTHCSQAHEYTPENTYVWHGRRQCRACKRVGTTPRSDRGKRVAA